MSHAVVFSALHHKLMANHFGRLGDQHADARDIAKANHKLGLAAEYAAKATEAYSQEEYHLSQRVASGKSLGGKQPSAVLAIAYATADK